jgi:plastocyanin
VRRWRQGAGGLLAALCSLGAQAAPLVVTVTDSSGAPLANAAVYVLVAGKPSTAPVGTQAEIGQRERQFQPRVTVIQTGTAVNFPNFDTVRHHVYSFATIRKFELKLYAGTPATPVVFDKPGSAALGCNIHDKMTAWVHVVDTPVFALTDTNGRATLDLPPGAHLLRTWHARLPEGALPAEQPLPMTAAPQQLGVSLSLPPLGG